MEKQNERSKVFDSCEAKVIDNRNPLGTVGQLCGRPTGALATDYSTACWLF